MRRPPLLFLYHGFGDVPRRIDPGNLIVRPDTFRTQIRAIRDRGYTFVTVGAIAQRIRAGESLEGHCAITFDDGLTAADGHLPAMLAELDEPVSIYICPGLLGEPHYRLGAEAGIRMTTKEELDALAALPKVEIGSHTSQHTSLATANESEAYEEMHASRVALEDLIGRPVETFAYPWCLFSPDCRPALERAGYTSAVTCGQRGSWDPYEIPRMNTGENDGRLLFTLKATGVYTPLRRSWVGRTAHRGIKLLNGGDESD